jgi:hypothetical protein
MLQRVSTGRVEAASRTTGADVTSAGLAAMLRVSAPGSDGSRQVDVGDARGFVRPRAKGSQLKFCSIGGSEKTRRTLDQPIAIG